MIETDMEIQINDLANKINRLETKIDLLRQRSIGDDMWDNSDMIRKWKISQRTLASWRADGLIDYVQVGGKIWYTKENRNAFLLRNTIKAKDFDFDMCRN